MDYRNMNNFLSKMLDKRFLAEENRGFSKALSSLWSTPYKGDDKVPDLQSLIKSVNMILMR